jgi:GTP cyclohydrolase I
MYELPDIQQQKDGFVKLPIEKVGVRNIKLPLKIRTKEGSFQSIVANISSYCNLVEDVKGINMSRISRTLVETMNGLGEEGGIENLNEFAFALQRAHNTDNVFVKAEFVYLIQGKSPVTQLTSYESVSTIFESTLSSTRLRNFLTIESTEMALCPCSKEMSLLVNNLTKAEREELDSKVNNDLLCKIYKAGYGAHNQKSRVRVTVEIEEKLPTMWIEDIVGIIKNSASSPTFATLKRPDEKYVTEISFMGAFINENLQFVEVKGSGPKFVEDIARNVAKELNDLLDVKIKDFVIVVNNQESIHSSDIEATAIMTAGRDLK